MSVPQFGLRTLIALPTITAFAIVTFEYVGKSPDESLVYSLIFAVVSAIVGVGMIALSAFFAVGVASTETDPNLRKRRLVECFHMLLFGLFGVGPLLLFGLFAILSLL